MAITTAQIRGARGILNWSQADLAKRTGVSATSIGSIENGQSSPRASTVQTIKKAFEDGGIEFIGREGVRLKTSDINVYSGKDRFWDFYEDIYSTVLKDPSQEIIVSNVDERNFAKYLTRSNIDTHIERMRKTEAHYKILIREGDTNYMASTDYAEYRWMSKDHFSSVPFYVYGKKLAMLLFDKEPTVIVLDYPAVADAYRTQFGAIWESAIVPPEKQNKTA